MIVPMKKVSLILLEQEKIAALQKLRAAGILHVDIDEGAGQKLETLQQQVTTLESALYLLGKKKKKIVGVPLSCEEALRTAQELLTLSEQKKQQQAEWNALQSEIARWKALGDFRPEDLTVLKEKGIELSLYEMPTTEYAQLDESVATVKLHGDKSNVLFLYQEKDGQDSGISRRYRLTLPTIAPADMKRHADELISSMQSIDRRIAESAVYIDAFQQAIGTLEKEIEFETYATGMAAENLSSAETTVNLVYFTGYVEQENLPRLQQLAKENHWGMLSEEPTTEDNVPTKLKNNKFVSLIYPLTDFLGTVPGYFEYDISGWFLFFILIFFGIIFGDGGYGLLITAIAAIPTLKSLIQKKPVSPLFLLVGLFGLSTMLWGMLTCTWFALSPEQLPSWLRALSVPYISNVYADKLWQPFWVQGDIGLTTSQNLQIFCFTLALIQLSVAHIMGAARNRRSVKMLGDIGSVLQLLGIYYLVLSLVVNPQVFTFGLVIGGVPVGTVAIALIGIGFFLSFVFSNYEGNLIKSILASMTNIVSVLLGVVNVFSDIVSYIRLWAVGLAGAAISATVNELAGPLFGNFLFMILAIILLVFGHGLNMILNILSVIVHGIRLNTLEFSSHLDMSWSGHKFKPFKEQID